MEKRKIYGTIIAILMFVLIITGLSYAYFYWSSGSEKTNVNLTITKGLEGVVVYKQGTSILGTDNYSLKASDDYKGGINATIEFWKKPSYTKNIYGQISLEVLQMLSVFGTTDANINKSDTVKWAITSYTSENPTEVLLQEGTFREKKQGTKFPLTENFTLNSIQTFYKIYIWLDNSAIDPSFSVIGELLSTEISASASDIMSHYGTPPIQVLASLGLDDKLKTTEPDFSKISPVVTSYEQNISTSREVNLSSTISGNKTLANGIKFDPETGKYTLIGTISESQTYNSNSKGKYTCNSTARTCDTIYKITEVNVSNATTDYSEASWVTYNSSLTSSVNSTTGLGNKTVSTEYSFDGTNYNLTGTITQNTAYSSSHIDYYTCNNNTTSCQVLYKIKTVSGTTVTSSQRKQRTQNYNYATKADIYNKKAKTYDETNIGIFSIQDDFGTSYFYRGNIDYNYVKFGKNSNGQDMYWRIIRINGDGSIRMIYDGTKIHKNGESSTDRQLDNVEYLDIGIYDGMRSYTESSVKKYFEGDENNSISSWYKENIINTGYSEYVADAIYCNDTEILNEYPEIEIRDYGSHSRFNANNSYPSLKCPKTSDMFTTSSLIGNGELKYPIGLINVDEAWLAGGYEGLSNTDYYLYTGYSYWTMTPKQENFGFGSTMYIVGQDALDTNFVTHTSGIKPVISLKSDAIKYGTGIETDPYRVE